MRWGQGDEHAHTVDIGLRDRRLGEQGILWFTAIVKAAAAVEADAGPAKRRFAAAAVAHVANLRPAEETHVAAAALATGDDVAAAVTVLAAKRGALALEDAAFGPSEAAQFKGAALWFRPLDLVAVLVVLFPGSNTSRRNGIRTRITGRNPRQRRNGTREGRGGDRQ
jgi:hypothetical protein